MVARGLRSGVKLLLEVAKLSEAYNSLRERFEKIIDAPIPAFSQNVNVVSVRSPVSVCSDPLMIMDVMFNCHMGPATIHYADVWLSDEGYMVDIMYTNYDDWENLLEKYKVIPLNSLRGAYIIYWLVRKGVVSNVKWMMEYAVFIERLIDAIMKEGVSEEPIVNVDNEAIYSTYLALTSAQDPEEYLPFGIVQPPPIAQHILADGTRFKPYYSSVYGDIFKILDQIMTIQWVALRRDGLTIYYVNKNGKELSRHIYIERMRVGAALFLIDLEKNYKTLTYFARIMADIVKHLARVVKITEELAALANIVGGKHG